MSWCLGSSNFPICHPTSFISCSSPASTLCSTGLLISPHCAEDLLCSLLPMFLCFCSFPVTGMLFSFLLYVFKVWEFFRLQLIYYLLYQSSSSQTYLFLSFWTITKTVLFILSEVVTIIVSGIGVGLNKSP